MTPKILKTIPVQESKITCEGQEDSAGHPRIFLSISPKTNQVICPYCSCAFVLTV